jgi:hypothetical protein
MVVSKTCSKCNILKDESGFYVDHRTGLPQSWCKDCKKKYNLLWKKTSVGKAAARRYKQGAAGKAAARRRAQSSKFNEYQRHYSKSSAGKARDKRYYQSFKGKKGKAAYRPRLRSKALLKVGRGKIECADCGFNIQRGLDINHKNGDGKIDRQKYKNRNTFYTAIIRADRSINDLMLLCKPCHQRFHFVKEYGSQFQEIQHQKKYKVMPITL